MARVFVSHATADISYAREVCGWLHDEGHDVFLDQDIAGGLEVGEAWKQRLYTELRGADAVVCLVTEAFLASVWCSVEVGVADSLGCLLLPVQVAGDKPHPLMEPVQHADYRADPAGARAQLAARLRRVDRGGRGGWSEGYNPFPGLAPFTAALAPMFFGRGAETRELADQLRAAASAQTGVTAVTGPSGCGKSSLVAAGLLPTLAADPSWLVLEPISPGEDPVQALARRLTEAAHRDGQSGMALTATRERLAGSADGLARLADDLLTTGPASEHRRLLVTIDQGEELFTRTAPEARDRFARMLRAATVGPVRVLVTLRSEFLDDLCALPTLAGVGVGTYLLRPLSDKMLAVAIEGPARVAGIRVEPELTSQLVADTDTADALPMLAFTLHQLAKDASRGDTLTLDRYHQLGGVRGALTRHADRALVAAAQASNLTPGQVVTTLVRLATIDGTGRRARRRARLAGLPGPHQQAVGVFVDHRLLVTDIDEASHVWVGPAHEALLTAWHPLDIAIGTHAAALHSAQAVEHAAADWAAAGRPDSYLWDEDRLTITLPALRPDADEDGQPAVDLTGDAEAFLAATRARAEAARQREQAAREREEALRRQEEAQRQRARRRRALTATGLAVLLLVTGAAGVAVTQWRSARSAQAEAEAARRATAAVGMLTGADSVRASDPHTAMQLGAAAYALHPGPETAASLAATVVNTRYAHTLTGHTSTTRFVLFAPDGKTLAAGSDDGTAILWDLADRPTPRQLGGPLTGHIDPVITDSVVSAAFAPDGKTLATASRIGTVILWDLADRSAPRQLGIPLTGDPGGTHLVAFTPDGKTMATGSYSGAVTLWDLTDPSTPRQLGDPLTAHPSALAFTQDGKTLAIASRDATVTLWDLGDRGTARRLGATGKIGEPLAVAEDTFVVAFAPDGKTLATGDPNGSVTLWDVADRAAPRQLGGPLTGHTGGVSAVAFASDGKTLATGGEDRIVHLWGLDDRAAPRQRGGPLTGHTGGVSAVAFAPDGKTLATGSVDGSTILWDLTERAAPRQLGQPFTGGDLSLAFAPDGKTLATGAGGVTLWDVTDRAAPRRLGQPFTEVNEMTFAPDGKTLAVGDPYGAVTLWDVTDRAAPRRLGQPLTRDNGDHLGPLAFAPDGKTLATGSLYGVVILWDVTDRAAPRQLDGPLTGHTRGVSAVAFAPDGKTLATGGEDTIVILWDLADRAAPRRLSRPVTGHVGVVSSVAFASDGRTLASGSGDGKVILWDLADRAAPHQLGQPLVGHTGYVWSVAFAAEGATLATGSDDHSVILWDLTDRTRPRPLGRPLIHSGPVRSVAFAPGHTLATGGEGRTILWDVASLDDVHADPLSDACTHDGGGIPRTVWELYAPGIPYEDPCAG